MKLITLIFTLFFLKSCGNTKEIANVQDNNKLSNTEILSGTYIVTMLGTQVDFPEELTLKFESKTNKVSGFSGCNQFMGSYTTENNTIKCSQLIATKMICVPEVDVIERAFTKHLTSSNSFEIKNGELILKNENEEVIHAQKKKPKITFIYKQTTRGVFEKIWITRDSISFSNDRELIETKSSVCNEEDWNQLKTLYNEIDVKSIHEIEPPTKNFQFDAAAMATLEIRIDNENYKTKIFDHGRPPKSIEDLVNKVLSMKKMIQKE